MIRVARKSKAVTVNSEARTFVCTASAGARVARVNKTSKTPYIEVIPVENADLSALEGGPLLLDHKRGVRNTVGRITRAWVENGHLMTEATFTSADDAQPIWQRISDGTLCDVSVGYAVAEDDWDITVAPDGTITMTARSWQPYEVSIVDIGADPQARIRSAEVGEADEDGEAELEAMAENYALARAAEVEAEERAKPQATEETPEGEQSETVEAEQVEEVQADAVASVAELDAAVEEIAVEEPAPAAAEMAASEQEQVAENTEGHAAEHAEQAAAEAVSGDPQQAEPVGDAEVEQPAKKTAANLEAEPATRNAEASATPSAADPAAIARVCLSRGMADLIPDFLERGFSLAQVESRVAEVGQIREAAEAATRAFGPLPETLLAEQMRSATVEQAQAAFFRAAVAANPRVGMGAAPQVTQSEANLQAVKRAWNSFNQPRNRTARRG